MGRIDQNGVHPWTEQRGEMCVSIIAGTPAGGDRAEDTRNGLGVGFVEDAARALGQTYACRKDMLDRLERSLGLSAFILEFLKRFLSFFVRFSQATFALRHFLELQAVIVEQHLRAFEGVSFVLCELL